MKKEEVVTWETKAWTQDKLFARRNRKNRTGTDKLMTGWGRERTSAETKKSTWQNIQGNSTKIKHCNSRHLWKCAKCGSVHDTCHVFYSYMI